MVKDFCDITVFLCLNSVFVFVWRRGGLMARALVSGSSGPDSSPGWGHCVVFLGKTLYSHSASHSTQVYKWVLANSMLGGNLAMD